MTHEEREIHRKKRILEHAERVGNINKTCRYFGGARSTVYLRRDGKKLAEWERFYNFDLPHGAHRGKTPYESLRDKLS
ncbi:MAG: hypothetical protein JRE81_14465 [Deltaproteobacteria bacterium]|jgi:hypothetical protein|nr:hypothetical protein [Deltaproteobacteria bacterium]